MRARSLPLLVALVLAAQSTVHAQNLLRNSGFEAEPIVNPGSIGSFPVIDGWISTGECEVHDISNAPGGIQGDQVLDVDDGDTVHQKVFVVPGQDYTLRYAITPRPGEGDSTVQIRFDGVVVDTVTAVDNGIFEWQFHIHTVTPTSELAVLEFEDMTGSSSGVFLDDVRLIGMRPNTPPVAEVLYFQKITNTTPNGPPLSLDDMFARSIANIGDLDDDGVIDLAVGAIGYDDDGDNNPGSVWIIFLNADGSVKGRQHISQTSGNFNVDLNNVDGFGRAVAGIGDLDLDGVEDIAVGSNRDDEAGAQAGAVFILFMNTDGTVKSHHKIHANSGVDTFSEPPGSFGEFGGSVACIGDLDDDGIQDLAIGRRTSHRVLICFMNRDGTVRNSQTIADGIGGFVDFGSPRDWFGSSCANIGDFDNDGNNDIVVGAILNDPYDNEDGNAYLLLLNDDGTVKDWSPLGPITVNETNQYIGTFDEYGIACAGPGDLDDDGVLDIVVGAHRDGPRTGSALNQGEQYGAVYVLFMNADGSIRETRKIGRGDGNFPYLLLQNYRWGEALAPLGDFNNDGMPDIAVGSRFDGGVGAAFLVSLNDGTQDPARADFTANPRTGLAPLTVTCMDRSTGDVDSLMWTFGDGTQSTDAVVDKVYDTPGVYTISLEAFGPGGSNTRTRNNWINVTGYAAPITAFSADTTMGTAPLTVNFTDETVGTVTSWSWDFGDGNSSTDENPTHMYTTEGTFTVMLTTTGPGGMDSATEVDFVTIAGTANADFTATPLMGTAPLNVMFTDTSTGSVTSWSWDFGDGGSSTDQNPTHEYASDGTYTVSLTIDGPDGMDTETKVDFVSVDPAAPDADFIADVTVGLAPLVVSFTDTTSGNVTAWSWDFGDGGSSTDQNPMHTYTLAGTYTVSLTATGPGGMDTETKMSFVTAQEPPPIAGFSGSPTSGVAPLDVNFTDASTGNITSWSWDFGDLGTSTMASPIHTYAAPGLYTVSLTVTGPGGSDTSTLIDYIDVAEPAPVASFSGTPTSGSAPLDVTFTDASTGNITSWSWDFGDLGTSTMASPMHTYNDAGLYTVSLTVTGPGGSDTSTLVDYVDVENPAPVASFTGTPTSGAAPLDVDFTDTSTGNITAWSWDFGDTNTSTDEDPMHTYTDPGLYTVSLTVTGPDGSDTSTAVDYIDAGDPLPVASFSGTPTNGIAPLEVSFTDSSTGDVTAWSWDFGDTNTSTDASPMHTYTDPGLYTVSLTVTGPSGSDTSTLTDYIDVADPPPVAAFTADPTNGYVALQVAFTDTSTGDVTSWSWDFGDTNGSTDQNPTHTYTAAGTYSVTLTVTGAGGMNAVTETDLITVDPLPPALGDGSFEAQAAGLAPVAPWAVLDGMAHIVTDVAEPGLPSEGSLYASISADGSDNALPGPRPQGAAGIAQDFIVPTGFPTLKFDAAFVRNGPADNAAFNDFMSVDITDGVASTNLYYADTFSATPEISLVDGLAMTERTRVVVDLLTLYPSMTDETVFTLTVQVGNGGDSLLPSRGYVDAFELASAATAAPYGCGVNPIGSLTFAGAPRLGQSMTLFVDNPEGTQAPGALSFVLVSQAPDPNFPCGTLLPGWSMSMPGGAGELLVAVAGGDPQFGLTGDAWAGPGMPVSFELPIPDDPALACREFYTQGFLVDPTVAFGVKFGATEGVRLVLGP